MAYDPGPADEDRFQWLLHPVFDEISKNWSAILNYSIIDMQASEISIQRVKGAHNESKEDTTGRTLSSMTENRFLLCPDCYETVC